MRARRLALIEPAFTLMELCIVIAIAAILVSIGVVAYGKAVDSARRAHCVGNLRTIAAGALYFAQDREGKLWTRDEVGFSAYRGVEDSLGLPQLLKEYVPDLKVWWCRAGRSTLQEYGNAYRWSVSESISNTSIFSQGTVIKTVIIWDNYAFTRPSIKDVRDGGTSTGPPAASARYHRMPHQGLSMCNWAFLDGHVILGKSAAQ